VCVYPLGGKNFKIELQDHTGSRWAPRSRRLEMACVRPGDCSVTATPGQAARQELYRVTVRADGEAVHEDDAEGGRLYIR
jgi:hypothetical protein